MRKQILIMLLLSLASASIFTPAGLASILVGVKEGHWIEYQVGYIGTPPEGHDAVWAKMEIMDIEETRITVRLASKSPDGKLDNSTFTLNLETGHLGDAFIIPSNLETGDTFLDETRGNITISETKKKTIAGAERTVVCASTPETTTYWDKPTGVAVESHAAFTNFTMITIAEKTNMWEPTIKALDHIKLWALLVTIVGILFVAIAFFTFLKKK